MITRDDDDDDVNIRTPIQAARQMHMRGRAQPIARRPCFRRQPLHRPLFDSKSGPLI